MNSGTTLYEEALALRADVREIVILLENWNTGRQPTRGGGGATPPAGIRPDDGPAGGVGVDDMEQIINGLKYDTDAAARVASNEYWDGHNWDRNGRNTYLYKTENGRYFLLHTSRWGGERDHIEPVSPDEARQYYEDLPEHEMRDADAFGEEPEAA